jgi:DNA-binding NarL/FixJ family response regulator
MVVRVVVVDDQDMVRSGFAAPLSRRNRYLTASRAHASEIHDRLNDVKRRLALGHPVTNSRDNPVIFFSLS